MPSLQRNVPRHELVDDRSINMTPMIDVVFQLILFFMLTSSLARANSIELDLPDSTSSDKVKEQKNISITYRLQEGKPDLRLNGRELAGLKDIGRELRAVANAQQQPQINVQIDRAVPYQHVISLIDAVRDSGFHKFSLLTLKSRSGEQ